MSLDAPEHPMPHDVGSEQRRQSIRATSARTNGHPPGGRQSLMKAVVYEQYGGPDVLRFAEVPTPVPGPDEVLIRIHATTVNSADWRVRSLEVPAGFGLLSRFALGIRGPRQPILGTELSGVIASVGRDVTKFKDGDAVFTCPGVRMGCHAEYRCMAQDAAVALKPANVSHAQAAAVSFRGTTALHFLRKAGLGAGETVLRHGGHPVVEALRCGGDGGMQRPERRAGHVAGGRMTSSTTQKRASPATGARTTSSSTRQEPHLCRLPATSER
ncbi:MAG TPA: alcohol dehydrogenase catalytic domain-containing protein [Thermoanaerobaculia bacterium]|jgi:hypothetical protein